LVLPAIVIQNDIFCRVHFPQIVGGGHLQAWFGRHRFAGSAGYCGRGRSAGLSRSHSKVIKQPPYEKVNDDSDDE
jgi:hypothetical protein